MSIFSNPPHALDALAEVSIVPSWGGAELEVALSLVGSPGVMAVTGRKSSVSIYCYPQPSYTLLASREGASQMEVRDRWCWSGCQPSWIQAEPAVVESNAKNCGRTELWLHLVGGGGRVGTWLDAVSEQRDLGRRPPAAPPRSLLS